mmetsp:Transcript_29087/g.55948  ORF Transcript_29087/g.55948 Transcript_29087/m.55948 type:complete len:249 (-) Transcript_29087:82-828(-)
MVFVQQQALRDSSNDVNTRPRNTGLCGVCSAHAPSFERVYGKDRFRTDPMHAPRRLGYIRVSTRSQAPDRQVEALRAECDELHIEHVSAVADERPVFDGLLERLNSGDSFVVMDLDRAFRSSIDAILIAEHLRQQNVTFRILSMAIDTSTPEGELYYTIIAGYAQFERRIISRRTKEGLDAARARGVVLGRRPKLSETEIRNAHARLAVTPCAEIAASLSVSRPTLQRAFKRLGLSTVTPPQRKGKPP